MRLASTLFLAVIVGGCATSAPPPAPAPRPAHSATPPPAEPRNERLCPSLCDLTPTAFGDGEPFASVQLKAQNNRTIDLASLRGKVVLLHVWRHPLPEVIEELPALAKLARDRSFEGLQIISLSLDEDPVRARQAYRELLDQEEPYPLVVGESAQAMAALLGPEKLPTSYLVDQQGKLRGRFEGHRAWGGPAARAFFAALSSGGGCSATIEAGQVTPRAVCAARGTRSELASPHRMTADANREWPWFLPESRTIGGFTFVGVQRTAGKTITLDVDDAEGKRWSMKIPVKERAADPIWYARFEREVEILRMLVGKQIPALRAFGTYSVGGVPRVPYIVTSLPIGPTLRDIIAQRMAASMPPDVVGAPYLLRALAEALSEVHEKGIVHRNLRPDKIAVAGNEVQILDFVLGLSHQLEGVTQVHEFLGTPDYIAPEQARSPHGVDARADLYALGLILYEYLTFARAFGKVSNKVDAFLKHVTQEPERPSSINPDVPRDLDSLVLRLLKKNRDERPASADALIAELDVLLQSRKAAALSYACVLPESGVVDGFRVQDAFATTGSVVLLRVEDSRKRHFAMRVPARQLADDLPLSQAFAREVAALKEIAGPRFPTLRAHGTYAAGPHKVIPYIVTDVPIGPSLREVIERRRVANAPPDVQGGLLLLRKLSLLLGELHAKGVTPCTMRPDRIAVAHGEVQLLELALTQGDPSQAVTGARYSTAAGYFAPEQLSAQARQQPPDPRSDQYALGVLMYEYLTYDLPFGPASTAHEMRLKHIAQEATPPSHVAPDIPPFVDDLVLRLLKPTPAERFESAYAVSAAVARSIDPMVAPTSLRTPF